MATESWLQGATSRVTPRLIGLDRLTPSPNPLRTIALDENLAELAASIANQGVLHPLLVRAVPGDGDSYEVIAGDRRRRAAVAAGLVEVPCLVCDADPQQAFLLSLVENLQRNNLHPLDEAWAYDRMMESGVARNRAEIARRLGVSRARITQRMQLLLLDQHTKLKLIQYATTLSEYHARLLLTVTNLDARHQLAEMAGKEGLSGRELRAMIEELESDADVQSRSPEQGDPFPRSYQVTVPGLRLSINYSAINPSRALQTLRRAVAQIECQLSSTGAPIIPEEAILATPEATEEVLAT
jgi:ParB family chromosome partitioning protein